MTDSRRATSRRREGRLELRSVAVSGYKSLKEKATVPLGPLTVLAGANSSGKSSALQPLLLLKQTLQEAYDPGPLLLDGPHVRFTAARQLFTVLPTVEQAPMHIEVCDSAGGVYSLTFACKARGGVEVQEMSFKDDDDSFAIRPGMQHADIVEAIPRDLAGFKQYLHTHEHTETLWSIERRRCFLGFQLRRGKKRRGTAVTPIFSPADMIASPINEMLHVPGLRGNPARSYRRSGVGREFTGTFDKYVASVVHQWQTNKDKRLVRLGETLQRLGLASRVSARNIDDTSIQLQVGRVLGSAASASRDVVSIADVGFGVSQALPVVAALLLARPGQVVFVEQPELHLHPRAQYELAKILCEAVSGGARVVVETHSALLLLGLQTVVAKGGLDPANVHLLWFVRGAEDGLTTVSEGGLDERGAFGEWPEDFGQTMLVGESAYLDAVEARF